MEESMESNWPPVDMSEIGEIREAEQECPGVYYVSLQRGDERTPAEFYLVLADAPISAAARRFGQTMKNGQGLLYPMVGSGHSKVIEYESMKYRVSHGISLRAGESLRSCAAHGAEECPDYFGLIPAPAVTPWGHTLRYKNLGNGIYWVETDRLVEGLAVAYPAWGAELTDDTIDLAQSLDDDDEMSYRFFSVQNSAPALFELALTRPWWVERGLINVPAIVAAVKERFPEYALNLAIGNLEDNFVRFAKIRNANSDVSDLDGSDDNFVIW